MSGCNHNLIIIVNVTDEAITCIVAVITFPEGKFR